MTDNKSILQKVIDAISNKELPISIKVDDVEKDHRSIYKFLRRRDIDVGIAKEKERSLLWFLFKE